MCVPWRQKRAPYLCFGRKLCVSEPLQPPWAEILYQSSSRRPSYFSSFSLFLSPLVHNKCEAAEPLSPLNLRARYVNTMYNAEKLPGGSPFILQPGFKTFLSPELSFLLPPPPFLTLVTRPVPKVLRHMSVHYFDENSQRTSSD